jgi:hypothetical protein
MAKIYSYVLRYDDGAAPNPFWGTCTLTICKPAIRRTAEVGDWIIGTGSKNTRLKDGNTYDLSDSLVYAMKVTNKLSLAEYDSFCQQYLPNKLPDYRKKDWRYRMGDCIYNYSIGPSPTMREGNHTEIHKERDLSGKNALLSNCFYYFGEEARPLPYHLRPLIKRSQGHRKILSPELVKDFEVWIEQFEQNKVYAEPQLKFEFALETTEGCVSKCARRVFEEEIEEAFC